MPQLPTGASGHSTVTLLGAKKKSRAGGGDGDGDGDGVVMSSPPEHTLPLFRAVAT